MGKLLRALTITIIIILTLQSVSAQEKTGKYILKGVISDSITGKGVPWANAALLKRSDSSFIKGISTEEDGSFILEKLAVGEYILRLSSIGYAQKMTSVIIGGDEMTIVLENLYISQVASNIIGAEITEKKPVYLYNADKKIYNVSEDPSVQAGVATDALQNAPGVWVDLEGNITLRGVSGVAIWINGKPSKLNADALKEYLRQLPANALERIEVMTNPSAKYSASGTGGIINIVTRQKITKNWFFSIGGNATTRPNYSPWSSFVWSNEKFKINLYANYSEMVWKGKGSSESLVLNEGDTLYGINSFNKYYYKNKWVNGYLDIGYQMTEKDELDVWFGGNNAWSSSGSGDTSIKDDRQLMTTYSIFDNNSTSGNSHSYYGGFTYTHKFNDNGHEISMDLYGWQYKAKSASVKDIIYTTDEIDNKLRITDESMFLQSGILYLNYTYPLNDSSTIEAGLNSDIGGNGRTEIVDTSSNAESGYNFAEYLSNRNKGDSRNMDLYATWSSRILKLDYKIGMRAEYRFYHLNSISTALDFNREFINIYPSVYLSYVTKTNHSFSVSYSRRVECPEYQLDPFIQYSDEEGTYSGNPWLKAANTNSFEFSYSKYFKTGGSISTTIYHRYTGKEIIDYTTARYDTLLDRYTLYTTYINAGKNRFTGLELSLFYRPVKFLNMSLSGNGYYNSIKADFETYSVDKNIFSWSNRISATFSFLKTGQFQITGNYRSTSMSISGSSDPVYYINAYLKADFFKRKLSLSAGAQDIFNWTSNKTQSSTPTLISSSYSKTVTRYFTFGLTLRFGKIEMEREVKTGQGQSPGAQ